MCECQERFPTWSELVEELMDEIKELILSPLDRKEWSDVGRGLERLVEKGVGRRGVVNLGGGLNRRVQLERLERSGCIRSERWLERTGGVCVTQYLREGGVL